ALPRYRRATSPAKSRTRIELGPTLCTKCHRYLSPSGCSPLVEDFFAQQLSLSWPRMKENLLLNSLEFWHFLLVFRENACTYATPRASPSTSLKSIRLLPR